MNAINSIHLPDVRIKRDALLETLKKNRENHVREYNEALVGYKTEFRKAARKLLAAAKNEDHTKHVRMINLPVPTNHELAYDQAIRMYELSQDEIIELPTSAFSCLVMDEWEWSRSFKASNSTYANYLSTNAVGSPF